MANTALHRSWPTPRQAERATVEGQAQPARRLERRGPMRPEALVSSRQRLRGDWVASTFRVIDAVVLALVSALVAAAIQTVGGWTTTASALAPFFAIALIAAIGLNTLGAYGFRRRESWSRHLTRVAAACALAGLTVIEALVVASAPPPLVQAVGVDAALSGLISVAAHGVWLNLVRDWRRKGYLTPNVVVVGANDTARLLIERALRTGEIAVLGLFDDRLHRAPDTVAGVPVLGDTRALLGHGVMPYVDRVVIAVSSSAKGRVRTLVERLSALPNDITLFMDLGSPEANRRVMDRMSDLPLAQLSGRRSSYARRVAKRIQDLAVGLLALILAAPLMILIALAIRLESPGPIFFRQRRHGFNNEEIVVWKFRSMRDAPASDGVVRQVQADDPRVTRVGRLIRRTSLDELPQLFNVLAGEMSLVGPRPHAPSMKTGDVQSALLVAHYAHRHRIKPGMTGWAAVNGSRGPIHTPAQVRQRVELDVAYIERQSLLFDLMIMLMTLPCLVGDSKVAR